ncbi:MAG: efflux RND transporter periplasmic adaptor subunit [bacterium]|nr:efflux RND transporter periplasmic adaptor subunit [bacterium]
MVWAQRGRPAIVEVAVVERKAITQPVTFVGTVEPRRRSLVSSEVEGIVAELLVEDGQRVKQGETLVQLRQESIRIGLQALRSTAQRYREELAELKNGTRPEIVAEAHAAVLEAEAELDQARREKSRQLDLSQRGVSALRARENAETATVVAQQRLARARSLYQMAVRGPRAERISQAEAQYRSAQAEVERLKYDLRRSRVAAPFTGYVVAKHTEVGQWLGRGDLVVTLIELDVAHVTVPIPERYISQVHLGDYSALRFDAIPGRRWDGRVVRIIPQAGESRTFPITIAVDNAQTLLKSGFVARAMLTVGGQRDALLVPKDAVVSQGPRQIVYVVREGKAAPVPIQRTSFFEGSAVVIGDLQKGEQVVIRGNERLRPGQAVQVVGSEQADRNGSKR